MSTILRTIHGSHLYGLAHADSDVDHYTIINDGAKDYAHQEIHDGDDQFVIHLDEFIKHAAGGVPQALESLNSPRADIDHRYLPMLRGLRPNIDEARARYRRTVRNFAHNNGGRTGSAARNVDPIKLKRHAVRLCFNLNDLMLYGRFNPELTEKQIKVVKAAPDMIGFNDWLEEILYNAQLGRLYPR